VAGDPGVGAYTGWPHTVRLWLAFPGSNSGNHLGHHRAGDGHVVGRSVPGRIADLAADRWGCAGDSRGGCVAEIGARALVCTCGGLRN